MSSLVEELRTELGRAGADDLLSATERMISRIRAMSLETQRELAASALREWSAADPSALELGGGRRTLLRVILHATRIGTVDSAEEQEIRRQIKTEIEAINGDAEGYASMRWRGTEDSMR